MKKLISSVLIVLAIAGLIGCGSSEAPTMPGNGNAWQETERVTAAPVETETVCGCVYGVPDSILNRDIESSVKSSSYSVYHNVDEIAHTDDVTVEYSSQYDYYDQVYSYRFVYQYNKSNDTWSAYGDSSRPTVKVIYRAESLIGYHQGKFGKYGGEGYWLNITDVDFNANTISGSFGASAASWGTVYNLNTSGTYTLKDIGGDQYEFEVPDGSYTFVFRIGRTGFIGSSIYETATGSRV